MDELGDYYERMRRLRAVEGTVWSRVPELVTIEDLVEAPGLLHFDARRQEWAFTVLGASGYPRTVIGVCVLRARDDGALVMALEGYR